MVFHWLMAQVGQARQCQCDFVLLLDRRVGKEVECTAFLSDARMDWRILAQLCIGAVEGMQLQVEE